MALPDALAHHATRVLRLRVGDDLVLFDGRGGECAAKIESVGREVVVALGARRAVEREARLSVTLYQALPAADKMDFVVQKAVELGVARIVPVAAARCVLKLAGERAEKRVAHWQQVAVAACEQCGRNRVPEIAAIASLPQALAAASGARFLLAPGGAGSLRELAQPAGPIDIFVGPEGGWSEDEIATARAAGAQLMTLGPRVLRTETAGLAALSAFAALWGDF